MTNFMYYSFTGTIELYVGLYKSGEKLLLDVANTSLLTDCSVNAFLKVAEFYLQKNDQEKAEKYIAFALKKDDTNADVYYLRSQVFRF